MISSLRDADAQMPKRQMTLNAELAAEAKSTVALAFRNGPIEDVHAGKECPTYAGKVEYSHITQDEMKNIMKRAVDTVYKLLCLKQNDPETYEATLEYGNRHTRFGMSRKRTLASLGSGRPPPYSWDQASKDDLRDRRGSRIRSLGWSQRLPVPLKRPSRPKPPSGQLNHFPIEASCRMVWLALFPCSGLVRRRWTPRASLTS